MQHLEFLSIVIPVYNSQETIGPLVDICFKELGSSFRKMEVILVNDGSYDLSHERCLEAVNRHPGKVRYLTLSRNFGEHSAVMCGLNHVSGDCAAIIDDDFQNPPQEIVRMVECLSSGHDVVYSYYEEKKHSILRNRGSRFNDFIACMLLKKLRDLYLSSFKVMNRFLIDTIVQYKGPYPYIDGLVLRSTNSIGTCKCRHEERREGQSNYTFRKLIRLWLNMFTSFSVVPLRASAIVGLCLSILAGLLTVLFVVARFRGGFFFAQEIPPGWASTIIMVTFFSGIQLCLLGLVGEYLGRMFMTLNRKPQFIVREDFGKNEDELSHGG
jgi:glycosyltransferase involved in cell wall biosynthesis